jgi:hypothetical protein
MEDAKKWRGEGERREKVTREAVALFISNN